MAVAAMFFMTVFPGFILIDWIDTNSWNLFEEGNETNPLVAFWFYFVLSIPASLVLVTLTILLAAGLRRLFLPRQKAGIFSRLWPHVLPDVAFEPRARTAAWTCCTASTPRCSPRPGCA